MEIYYKRLEESKALDVYKIGALKLVGQKEKILAPFRYSYNEEEGCLVGVAEDEKGFYVVGWEWKPKEVFASPHRFENPEDAQEMVENIFKSLCPV